jgi:hypothetical protein
MNLIDVEVAQNEAKPELAYAVKVTRLIFTPDELSNGIFPLANGKSRSKDRHPFDSKRIDILKSMFSSFF